MCTSHGATRKQNVASRAELAALARALRSEQGLLIVTARSCRGCLEQGLTGESKSTNKSKSKNNNKQNVDFVIVFGAAGGRAKEQQQKTTATTTTTTTTAATTSTTPPPTTSR